MGIPKDHRGDSWNPGDGWGESRPEESREQILAMPSIETLDCLQRAVLWPYKREKANGEVVVGPPQVLAPPKNGVSWNDTQSNTLDTQGNSVTVDATVVFGDPKTVAPVGSLIWLGSLGDFAGAWNNSDTAGTGFEPEEVAWPSGIMQVKTQQGGSDLKNRFVTKSAGLLRYKGRMPTVEP